MVHVPKVIQSSRLTHLTQIQEKHVSAEVRLLNSPPYTTEYFTVSLMCSNILPPHLVINVSCDVQVPLTANHSLVKPPQHL